MSAAKHESWETRKAEGKDSGDLNVSPLDPNNVRLLDNVHPCGWTDPVPPRKYNLVVVGAGASGLVSAAGAAGVGARVAIIEKELMGGDCLNVGCVPSKALIRCARSAHEVRSSGMFGVKVEGTPTVDFGAVMERMRRLRADISHVDSAKRFQKDLGVDVFQGRGSFTGPDTIEVNGTQLTFAAAVIATGGRASVPPIQGLKDVPYLTNATLFNLTELPKRLAVIGGGPIGMELSQCFRRFGSEVTVLDVADRVLLKEEREAADIVYNACVAEGIKFVLPAKITNVSQNKASEIVIALDGTTTENLIVDAVLVATGRSPNVENMGLEAAGVEYDQRKGIIINDRLQTSNKNIYAVGDVSCMFKFTHVADFMARSAIRNALFFGRQTFSSLLIPWATYTDPEIAHVGAYEADLEASKTDFDVYKRDFRDVDRAILDGDDVGYVKILTKQGTDKILGATIVATHAGDMISEITVALQHDIGLGSLATVIHPYPTQAEAIRQCGDQFNKTRLTKKVQSLFSKILAWKRK